MSKDIGSTKPVPGPLAQQNARGATSTTKDADEVAFIKNTAPEAPVTDATNQQGVADAPVGEQQAAGETAKEPVAGEQKEQQDTGETTAPDLRAQLELIAVNAWRQLAGRDDLSQDAFIAAADNLILEEVIKIEGHGDLTPRNYFAEGKVFVDVGGFTFNSTEYLDQITTSTGDLDATAKGATDLEETKQDPVVTDPSTDSDATGTGTGVIDELESLTKIAEKAFHYAGITDSLDDYITIMNGNKVTFTVGANQQLRILGIFKSILTVPDSLFEKVLEAVLVRFRDNIDEGKCFNEYKRSLYLIDPKSTEKNPSATFRNKADFDYFNNMMALLSAFSSTQSRKDVIKVFNVDRVFQPIRTNRVYTHGIERFIDFLKS